MTNFVCFLLQSSTFSRHESTKDHLFAAQARHSIQTNITVQNVVESLQEQEHEQDTDSIRA